MSRNKGFVQMATGLNIRLESGEERISELEKEAAHFAKNIDARLAEVERLEGIVSECDGEIESLQARRDELRADFMESSFLGDTATSQAIQTERAAVDKKLDELRAKRESAQATLNRTRSSIEDARQNTWEALGALTIPDDEQLDDFINALVESFTTQRQRLLERIQGVERGFELPSEREQREASEREAEQKREAARKIQERKKLVEKRNYYGKLLNNLSHLHEPHTGHRAWIEYLDEQGIEYRTESTGHTTFIGKDEDGNKTLLDPQSIVADVKAAYYEAMHELGEEVEEPQQ